MVDFADDFNAADVEPSSGYDVVPAGTYEAEIIESERREISKREDKGDCISLTWQIRGGPHDGRKIWQRVNLFWNGPEKTPGKVREIAQRELSAICHATGQIGARNTETLFRRPCLIKVSVRVDPNGQYDDQNEVKKVMAISGASSSSRPSSNGATRQQEPRRDAAPARSASGGWNRPTR